jgi:hypothetical protein
MKVNGKKEENLENLLSLISKVASSVKRIFMNYLIISENNFSK